MIFRILQPITWLKCFSNAISHYFRNPLTTYLMIYIVIYGMYLILLFLWVLFGNAKIENKVDTNHLEENHHITQHIFSGMLSAWLTLGYSFCRWIYIIFGMISASQGLNSIAQLLGIHQGSKHNDSIIINKAENDSLINEDNLEKSAHFVHVPKKSLFISRYSYGYQRLEVLIRFSISILICFICLALCAESAHAFIHFHYIKLYHVFKITTLGILLDLIGYYIFRNFLVKSGASSWWPNQTVHTTVLNPSVDSGKFSSKSTNSWPTYNSNTQWILGNQSRDIIKSVLANSIPQLLLLIIYELLGNYFSSLWDSVLTWLCSIIVISYQVVELYRDSLILLQTTPNHMQNAISKCLRELSMVDGVLEYHSDHFWTIGYGIHSSVGTITVRVREDANEVEISRACRDIFSTLVNRMSIQIEKSSYFSTFGSNDRMIDIPLYS